MNQNCHKWKTWFLKQNDLYSFYGSFSYKKGCEKWMKFTNCGILVRYFLC